MAIKYRISESGIQKIIEVLNDDVVVGVRKFSPKEISVSYNEGTIQINDAFTGNTLFEGESADFVKSDNSVFAQNAGDAVLAMTELTNNIAIDIRELDGIELVNDAIAPDLSAYVKTTELNTYKLEVASSIEDVSNNIVDLSNEVTETFDTVEQYLDTSEKGIVYQFSNDGTRCDPNLSVTFTTGDNGNVEFLVLNIHASLNTAAAIDAVVSTSNPGTGVSYNAENSADNGNFFEANAEAEGEIYSSDTRLIYSPMTNPANIGSSGRFQMSLTPNTEYTFYLWARTTILGVNSNPKLIFNDGLKVKVID